MKHAAPGMASDEFSGSASRPEKENNAKVQLVHLTVAPFWAGHTAIKKTVPPHNLPYIGPIRYPMVARQGADDANSMQSS